MKEKKLKEKLKEKLKVIKNPYVGSNQWKKDPTIPDWEIEIWNELFLYLGKKYNKEDIAKELIWDRKKEKKKEKSVTLQIIK